MIAPTRYSLHSSSMLFTKSGSFGVIVDDVLHGEEGERSSLEESSQRCRVNLDVELAEIVVRKLMELRSDHCADYVLLSNTYTTKGMWDDARVRREMKERHIRKNPAFSLIGSSC
ncbi:hypothetical protein GW17_00029823 [Ensete ventricosum]|nr:hypothetical protein GW17_00029823 [Ensete ventricosum]RZR83714.1 hypothetical protein BHM03_00010399 [Ensete ventricosum]